MKLVALIMFATLTLTASSQERNAAFAEPTSKVIADISNDWKKDSLGKNGYRSQIFERIRYSNVDSLTKEDLFKALGKPHHVSKFYSGNTHKNYIGYRYYVLCLNDYPKQKPYMGSFIEFVFDETETRFLEISDGEYCR